MAPTQQSPPTNTPRSRNFSDVLTILLDASEHPFILHKDILTKHSKFFHAACSGRWPLPKDKTFRLPDFPAESFQLYVEWLYTSEFASAAEPDKPLEKLDVLFHCYVLGGFVDDYAFRNRVVELLIDKVRFERETMPSSKQLQWVYENTPERSPLRKLVVCWIANVMTWKALALRASS